MRGTQSGWFRLGQATFQGKITAERPSNRRGSAISPSPCGGGLGRFGSEVGWAQMMSSAISRCRIAPHGNPSWGMPIRTLVRRGRTSPRLDSFDYSTRRWYFVTVNAKRRQPLFGALALGGVHLSDVGSIVAAEWQRTAELRSDVALDAFVIMPDHFHGLVGLHDNDREHCATSLSAMMNGFKAAVTSRVRRLPSPPAYEVWHRSFHDAIIRGQRHFDRVRRYIEANPSVAWRAQHWPGSPSRPN